MFLFLLSTEEFTGCVDLSHWILAFEFLIIILNLGLFHLCSFADVQQEDDIKGLLFPFLTFFFNEVFDGKMA